MLVFERRTFARLVTVKDGHPDVVEMWLSYCVRNQFFGTGMKAHIFSYDYVGVGKTMEKDIKELIEDDRWSVDGYNMLQDDASVLKRTIDNEISRIESQIASRDNVDRARKILQNRVGQLLELEGQAEHEAKIEVQEEAKKQLWAPPKSREEFEEQKDRKERMYDHARRGGVRSVGAPSWPDDSRCLPAHSRRRQRRRRCLPGDISCAGATCQSPVRVCHSQQLVAHGGLSRGRSSKK